MGTYRRVRRGCSRGQEPSERTEEGGESVDGRRQVLLDESQSPSPHTELPTQRDGWSVLTEAQ